MTALYLRGRPPNKSSGRVKSEHGFDLIAKAILRLKLTVILVMGRSWREEEARLFQVRASIIFFTPMILITRLIL